MGYLYLFYLVRCFVSLRDATTRVYIVAGDRQRAMLERSREDLIWDPAVMDSVSEQDGMSRVISVSVRVF